MNGIIRSAARIASLRSLGGPVRNAVGKREFTRTLWHMSKGAPGINTPVLSIHKPSMSCTCGCGIQYMHTKGEGELVEFLTEEILAEKKAQKVKTIPTELDGFKVKLNGADVELIKETEKEKIVVSFNVNHTVDADEEVEPDSAAEKPNFSEMKSRPTFEIDITKKGKTLSFTCSFLQGPPEDGENFNDIFGIDEITMYDKEWTDKDYAVAGDVLDGYLYDLLMNILEEKGISNEFVEKLSTFSTAYEHTAYIGLLESLSKYTTDK